MTGTRTVEFPAERPRERAVVAEAFRERTDALHEAVRTHTELPAGSFLAMLFGVHQVTFSRWRTGSRKVPRAAWPMLTVAEQLARSDPAALVFCATTIREWRRIPWKWQRGAKRPGGFQRREEETG